MSYIKHLPRLIKQQNGKCHYCGIEIYSTNRNGRFQASVDHIIPRYNGGSNNIANLVAACSNCNSTKQHMSYDKFIYYLDLNNVEFNQFLQKHRTIREKKKAPVERKTAKKNKKILMKMFLLLWKIHPMLLTAILLELEKNPQCTDKKQIKSGWETTIKAARKRRLMYLKRTKHAA